MLKDNVDYQIFSLEELKEWEWNPLVYNQSLANSIYLLVARDFAPAEQRIPNLRKRTGRNSRSHRAGQSESETLAENSYRNCDRADAGRNLVSARRSFTLAQSAPQAAKDLGPIQEKTAKALEEYKTVVAKRFAPALRRRFPPRRGKFRKKLRFALASDLSMEEIMKRAQADLAATQKAIYETALPLYKKYFSECRRGHFDDKKKVTAAVLDKLAEQHPDDNTIVGYAQKIVARSDRFHETTDSSPCRTSRLRSSSCQNSSAGRGSPTAIRPGPLEQNGKTFFAIEPTPKDWSGSARNRSSGNTTITCVAT